MVTNDVAASASDIANADMQKFLHEGLPYNSKDVGELQSALKGSSEVDMALAYSSEKLVNLENLLLHVLTRENGVGTIDIEDDVISAELIENAYTFDLLNAILIFDLRELDNLMCDLQDLIVDALHKISSCGQPTELVTGLVNKLHDSEDLIKQSQERILEMKIQIAKFQMTSFSFKPNEWKHDVVVGVKKDFQLASAEWKPQVQTVEQRRILRMLEKSLAGELELEKKLTELKQNEDDLKLKMRLKEQVAVCMEEAAEVAWGRFLKADNTAEVLMGISKEMLGKLQIVHFNLSGSIKREEEIKSKLQDCINQLNEKEVSIQKLNSKVAVLIADNAEVTHLRQKIQSLEEKLNETESRLKEANSSSETSQLQIKEMEGDIESLKESICVSEIRAGSAEEKITHLTDSNLELTEELDFLKGSNDSNTKRASLLEKQLRELDIQLQHARASSEASQEQQKMLYYAIWDMETLIDELKQKVAKAESKTESTEERCIVLSETNSELNKELNFLRYRMECMEISLNEVTTDKKASAKDINIKTNLIMDTVLQLAMEREHIQKQLISLTMENKMLIANLQDQKHAPVAIKSCNDKEFLLSRLDLVDAESSKTSAVKATEISSVKFQNVTMEYENQVTESHKDASSSASIHQNEIYSTNSANYTTDLILDGEAGNMAATGNSWRTFMFMAVLVVLLSVLAAKFSIFSLHFSCT